MNSSAPAWALQRLLPTSAGASIPSAAWMPAAVVAAGFVAYSRNLSGDNRGASPYAR